MKKKLFALFGLVVVIGLFAGISIYFQQSGNENLKKVNIEVISKRDNYQETKEVKTDKEFLGEALVDEKIVTNYEDGQYGMYIRGVENMNDDEANQYWWCILVDGKSAPTGAESLVLEDGATYTLELKQGY